MLRAGGLRLSRPEGPDGEMTGMLLAPDDAERFFRIHKSLLFYVNRTLGVDPGPVATPRNTRPCPRRTGSRCIARSWGAWT